MRKILLIASMLFGVAYGQLCETFDTVRANSATNVTYNAARINGSVSHVAPGQIVSIQLKYVRVGHTDTVTNSGLSTLRDITGLSASTTYWYYYKTICPSGSVSQHVSYQFTTLSSQIVYTDERPTRFHHVWSDTAILIPKGDTVIYRDDPAQPQIKYKTSDNTFYGYYPSCTCWRALAVDSSGIIGLLDGKVDSVTVSGDSLFYWKVGVSYGYILPSVATVWHTDGNAATDPTTDFLGTTDAKSLNFRVNNLPSGYIGYGPGSTYNTSFGYQALKNTATTLNTAIGYKSLYTSTSANSNTAIGFQALLNTTSGSANVGVGHDVLGTNSSGSYGTAIGLDALFNNTTGDGNTAVGYSAGLSNSTGSYNTAFGFTSGWGTTGSNNISIGAYAGLYNSTFSDRLYISSYDFTTHANDSLKAIVYGIQDGTTTANQKLFLNAELYAPYISSATSANTLYYNTSTKKVTYGAAPTTTSLPLSSLTAATATNTINNIDYRQRLQWNSLTGNGLDLESTSTAMINTGHLFSVTVQGTQASAGIATNAAAFLNANAGTSQTNNAIYASAINGATNNAIYVNAGNVNLQPLTASQFVSLDASKNMTSSAVASSILAASLSDETGTGVSVFGTSPAITTSLTTGSSTFALLNTTATTVNAFGAATTLNIGASASGVAINLGGGTNAANLNFLEGAAGGTNTVGLKAPATLAGNTLYTLPSAFPAGTYLMQSTNAGVLSFLDPATIPGTFALTNGNGTTANGTAVDLGGSATGAINVDMNSNNLSFIDGGSIDILRYDQASQTTTIGANTGNASISITGGTKTIFFLASAIQGASDGDAVTIVDHTTGQLGAAPNLAFNLQKQGTEIYASGGSIFAKDKAGNRTQLSPHDKYGNWIYNSTNAAGTTTEINMTDAIKTIEQLTKRVYELEKRLKIKATKPKHLIKKK